MSLSAERLGQRYARGICSWQDASLTCGAAQQFIDDTPELFKLVQSQNRAQKLLAYLGDIAVNGSAIKGQTVRPPLLYARACPLTVCARRASRVSRTKS
jgi:pyruvate carboxylase